MARSSSPSRFAGWLLLALSVVCLCGCVWGYSTLKVSVPQALVDEVNQATGSTDAHIPELPAFFGQPDYGSSITNQLYISNVANGCSAIDGGASGAIPNPSTGGFYPYFLLIDRGNCTFVTKMLNAQAAGAVGVVVANIAGSGYGYGDALVYMADDGNGKSVSIPSELIPLSHGDRLKRYKAAGSAIMLSMAFNTPAPDNRTEWEIWTSAYTENNDIYTFYNSFGTVVDTLKDRALFTPRYNTYLRNQFSCSESTCNSQCTASGYCYVQPTGKQIAQVSGIKIIVETVRQLCVYNSEVASGSLTVGHYWFQYVQLFQTTCQRYLPMKYNDDCANAALATMAAKDATFQQVNMPWINTCIQNNPVNDPSNPPQVLQWAHTNQTMKWNSQTPFIPSIFINEDMFTGTIVCSKLSPFTCPVLDDICNGYAPGTAPLQCSIDCAFGTPVDCSGACNGNSLKDTCGICLSPNSSNWNSCLDCKGTPHGADIVDSCGVCGGHGDSCSSSINLTGMIVGVVLGSVAIFGIVAFFIQRHRNRMKSDVNVLLQQYVPLADNFTVGPASGGGHSNSTGRGFPSRNSDPDRTSLVAGSASTSEEDL